jgi:acyl carrier protein
MVPGILEKVIKMVSDVTKEPQISQDSNQENTTGWDSLAYLVIAQELEDSFHIEITADNIDKVSSVKGIVDLITKSNGDFDV